MSLPDCNTDALLLDYLHGLESRSSNKEKDDFSQEWVRQVTGRCGKDSLDTVMRLRAVYEARKVPILPPPSPPTPVKLVILIHGIHDHGSWMEMVEGELQKIPGVVVQSTDFEFFNAFQFMVGIGVQNAINEVTHKIGATIDEVKPDEIIVIAHSFGTYVITKMMAVTSFYKVNRLILCGAVLPLGFQFDRLPQKPEVINECGGRDIWPIFASGFRLFTAGKYGAAGVFGMRQTRVKKNRHHDFGHTAYLKDSFVQRFWVPYITDGTLVESDYQKTRRPIPLGISLLATLGWWLIFAWIGVFFALAYFGPGRIPAGWESIVWSGAVGLCCAFVGWLGSTVRHYCYVPPKPLASAWPPPEDPFGPA